MSGARNAKDRIIWTERFVRPLLLAIAGTSDTLSVINTCSHALPLAIPRRRDWRHSGLIGRRSLRRVAANTSSRLGRLGLLFQTGGKMAGLQDFHHAEDKPDRTRMQNPQPQQMRKTYPRGL